MIVSRRLLGAGFLVIALTVSVLHQVESSAVLQRPSLVQSVLQHALAIGKRTIDFFFKPRLTMPKSFLASVRKFRFNAMLNGSRRRNLARMRLMKKRPSLTSRRRPVTRLH